MYQVNSKDPFPPLVIDNIARFLAPKDVCTCRLVCKLWKRSILPTTIQSKKLEFKLIAFEVNYMFVQVMKLQLKKNNKVSKIKLAIQEKFGTPSNEAVLILPKCRWQLDDRYTLKEYNIVTGTTLSCILFANRPVRPPGTPTDW